MVFAVGDKSVSGLIEFELLKLAERINVSANLTDGQVHFIAKQLMEMFPNETVADFKLCFERGAAGAYGRIYKLDGVEIGLWMTGVKENGKTKVPGYLDEKYDLMESEMMKEKDNLWAKAKTNTDWLQVWKEAVEKTDKEGGVKNASQNINMLMRLRGMTDEEIRIKGKENPGTEIYKNSTPHYETQARMLMSRAAAAFYKNKTHGFDLKIFYAPFIYKGIEFEVPFQAESEEDALKIYDLAFPLTQEKTDI